MIRGVLVRLVVPCLLIFIGVYAVGFSFTMVKWMEVGGWMVKADGLTPYEAGANFAVGVFAIGLAFLKVRRDFFLVKREELPGCYR